MYTPEELTQTLNELRLLGRDSLTVEVKSAHMGYPSSVAETICSFANLPDGGTIICGVDESQEFAPVGVYDVEDLRAKIIDAAQNLKPKIVVETDDITLDGHQLLIVTVPGLPVQERPCFKGNIAYQRLGDGDYPMDGYALSLMYAQRHKPHNDLQSIPNTSSEDLDKSYTEDFLHQVRLSSARLRNDSDAEILRKRNVIDAHDELTLAGLCALGDYPQQFYAGASIIGIVSVSGNARNDDRFRSEGPIPAMLEDTLAWFMRNIKNRTVTAPNGAGLIDQPEIPLVALREFVANALVHRSYERDASGKFIQIFIKRGRIEIISPGGFWGILPSQVGLVHRPAAVNEALYAICQNIRLSDGLSDGHRLIEGEGGGILAAQQALVDAGLRKAHIIDEGIQVRVIIYRPADNTQPTSIMEVSSPPQRAEIPENLSPTESQVYVALTRGPATVADIAENTELSTRQVRYALPKLIQRGLVEQKARSGRRGLVYRTLAL
ncbi:MULTISPECIES: RNA-binding domain-containing protein [Rothia]|jgi:predicted transcriptional regulator|uniref:RNA-binding domain-containing protein n=1 Tax=Rothia sp. HMSC069C04 TaxID=1739383 RepID=UPI0008A652B8|nr:RNA-binding domain-containing protein [Rothia sp. HMSC069C04]OFR59298.1 transcriptional regulator [Rothia sp. HMSC069C04]